MIHSLEDFKAYNLAMSLGEEVWSLVEGWDYFQKDTMGKQFVRATDSIAANLAEGLGRYHFKESKNFSYYARGSLFESKAWLVKANNRKLIPESKHEKLIADMEVLAKMLNAYINSIGGVSEPEARYGNNENLSPNS